MTDSWVNSAEILGSDLPLELSGTGNRRAVLMRALREAITNGRLAPGTRLPPYRSLAVDLGLARNTVADAYAELVAEGWLAARQGSGTRVAERAVPLTRTYRQRTRERTARPVHDLVQGSRTPRSSRGPPGWPRPGGHWTVPRTTPSGPVIRTGGPSCARP